MPGAGKTTLVNEVSRRALEMKFFSEAVLVPVSNTPDVGKIQKAIAERLELKLDKETIPERALLLRSRLQQEKMLIILDDVWKELNLKDVGIVFEGDQKGCKILFTSRFERVLQTDMGVDKIFKVGLLQEAEALNWFSCIVAQTVEKYSECAYLVNDIVEECARLPITIETIACALKDRRQDIWQDVLNQLKNSNLSDINSEVNEKVFNSIELCYNYVHKNEAKLLLLLCSLFGEDESIPIEVLMRHVMGWGILKKTRELQDARAKVHSLIDELKDRALLLDGDEHHTVKMHDIIRDVAISIARKSHFYCLTDDSEVRCLESEVLQKSKVILPLYEKLPSSLCSLRHLRTLILSCQNVEDISMIGGLKNLEILDLSACGIEELPIEVGKLPCLRMLDLRGCTQLKIIQPDVISNLKSLEELYVVNSFSDWDGQVQGVNGDQRNASLDELKLLKRLTTLHLKIVDIEVLPKDLFRSIELKQYQISIGCPLTDMLIDYSSRCLELRLDENKLLDDYGLERLLASTQTLCLDGLQGARNVVYELDKDGFPDLKQFKLKDNRTIQCFVKSTEQIHPCSVFENLETLQLDNLENLQKISDGKLTKESFKRLRIIKVSNCNMLKNLLPFSMSKLEKIKIEDCGMMEEIVSDHEEEEHMSKEVIGDFPQLRSLKLKNVPRLKSFCSKLKKIQRSEKGKQPMDVDNSVKTLLSGKIYDLGRLTTFSSEIDIDFPVLTKLCMEYCPKFSTFISKSEDEKLLSLFNEKVAFPSLKNLEIRAMNKLKMIANNADVFCKLEELQIFHCNNVMKIFGSGMQRALGSIRSLDISFCDMLEEVFEMRTSSFEEITHDTISAQLIHLSLSYLPKLRYVWNKDPQGTITFAHLEDVVVMECPSLKSIFPLSIAKGLSKLRKLSLFFCGIEQIVEAVRTTVPVPPEFVFPLLEEIELEFMKNLVRFYPGPHTSIWPSLTSLVLKSCEKVKVLASELSRFQEELAHNDHDDSPITLVPLFLTKVIHFPQLRSIELSACLNMKEIVRTSEKMNKMPFPKLDYLGIKNLGRLTTFSSEIYIDFPVLTKLFMENCPQFSTFISKSREEKQPSLFNEKVAFPSLKKLQIRAMNNLKMIANNTDAFCTLEELGIFSCDNVMKIFGSGKQRALGSLRKLDIRSCDILEEVFEIQTSSFEEITHDTVSAPLICLILSALPKLRYVWKNDPQGAITFIHLEDVVVMECPSLKSIFPLSIAKELSKLRKLFLSFCGIEQIVEAVGTTVSAPPEFVFPQLEEMKLYHLENLACIYPGLHTSSWPSLTTLVVKKCEKVKVLEFSCFQHKRVHHDHDNSPIPQVPLFFTKRAWDGELLPKSPSFSKLTSLHVRGCGFLKNLFSSAVAANSKQLQSLKITDCKLIEEIMSKNGKVDKVEFTGLKLLNFKNLPNLVSFSTEIFTEFPLLTEVSINRCPMFKSFVSNLEDKDCTTMTSLFNDKVAFPSLQSVEIKGLVELKMIWQYRLTTADSFSKLKYVKVENCNNLVKIFPSNMQRRLHNLKRLEISDCEMVEEVFEIQTPNVEGTYNVIPSESELIHLSLVSLSKLKNVWSKDPQGTLTFPHLKEVTAELCPNLESIFPASIAKGLFQLQTLRISDCGIEYIVGKEEGLETAHLNSNSINWI
nr:uncharacterized protein LOC125421339 [Ziziphus jujuba var. spinosa]